MTLGKIHAIAELQYLDNDDQLGAYFASVAGGTTGVYEGNYSKISVKIENGRDNQNLQDLDSSGFKLVRQTSNVGDFYSDSEIQSLYELSLIHI